MRLLPHILSMAAITALLSVLAFLPFLPGPYDGLAVPVSGMAQFLGICGLLLVPIGAIWLICELKRRTGKRCHFAVASVAVLLVFAVVITISAINSVGYSLGAGLIALWAFVLSRVLPKLRLLKSAEALAFHPAPLYLVVVPVVTFLIQITLMARAAEFGRNRAIENSAPLVQEIEEYRRANGHYPRSLAGLWQDYRPSVIGIGQFHYVPSGDAYSVYFEQPPSFLHLATQEIVMYNPQDEHSLVSHDSDILRWTPEQIRARPGWYAVRDTSRPHWKRLFFD